MTKTRAVNASSPRNTSRRSLDNIVSWGVSYDSMTAKEHKGLKALYEALVPYREPGKTVDYRMIVEEGFPKFEEVLGREDFLRLMNYFGIGETVKGIGTINSIAAKTLVSKLRTIENAQYYLHGFKELVQQFADLLCGEIPENMDTLSRAKIVRMYQLIFCEYNFFVEDYCMVPGPDGTKKVGRTAARVHNVNEANLFPEEMFDCYRVQLHKYFPGSICYDLIMDEYRALPKYLRREIMDVCELKNSEGVLYSINSCHPNLKFKDVRKIKKQVHSEVGVWPFELYVNKHSWSIVNFPDIYYLYKTLKVYTIEGTPKVQAVIDDVDGNLEYTQRHIEAHQLAENYYIAGPVEGSRLERVLEYNALIDATWYKIFDETTGKEIPKEERTAYPVGLFMSAINFAIDMEYVTAETDSLQDIDYAMKIIEMAPHDALEAFKFHIISADELKELMGITPEIEEEVFGKVKVLTDREVVIAYARRQGFMDDKEPSEATLELIDNVIIPGNEDAIAKIRDKVNSKDAKFKGFEMAIGLNREYGRMYFNPEEIDCSALESFFMDVKHKSDGKRILKANALLTKLYCYIVDNEFKCGPRMRPARKSKLLKTSNLMKHVK